jgi:hypothetical protein
MQQPKPHQFLAYLVVGIVSGITFTTTQGFSAQAAEEEVFAWRLRAGIAIPTQQVLDNVGSGTTVSSLFNTDANYAIKERLRVGVMYEWHEHTINLDGPKFGNLTVNTLLSTVEFRVPRANWILMDLIWYINYIT